jgi:radical SAM protein with 4Fe4S-binding SPASM domain
VGEPLIGNTLFKILDKIDTDKTFVQFNTNGLLLTEEKNNFIIEKKLKLINFSIDAASKEKYRNIRRSDFDLVINNIRTLSLLKKSKNVTHPFIMINMVLMKENIGESIAFLDLAKEVGAEYVLYSVLNQHEEYEVYNNDFRFNYKEQMPDWSSESFRNLTQDIKVKAEKMGLKPIIVIPQHRDLTLQKDCQVKTLNRFFCLLPWEHLLVHADGKCFFCCRINQQEGLIGNLTYQSLEEVWHSKKTYEIRSAIAHGQMPVACSKCDVFGQVR